MLHLRRVDTRQLFQRTFAQSSAARSSADFRSRPHLPFLYIPTSRPRVRYLTTERKAKLKYEIKVGIKYTGYFWIAGFCFFAIYFAIVEEKLERHYPSPHEWTYWTRVNFRGGHCARYEPPPGKITDWKQVAWWAEKTLKRLEDPNIDGKDVKDAPHDCPPGTKDISAKSEEWRRGYYETMILFAKAAEYMDGWVLDTKRNLTFPPGTMIGPSNPFPKPLPPGFKGAPREEDCVLRFEPPDSVYLRILNTVGFNNRQKIEAGIAYASWLEYKGITGPASIVYEDAVRLAASERTDLTVEPIDKKTWILNEAAGPPSENLLNALTAYATFRARQGDVASALPIFVSILKARRSLQGEFSGPTSITASLRNQPSQPKGTWAWVRSILVPPAYPPPPPDGTAPPVRDAKALCQEAALSLHIGEIMYTTPGVTGKASSSGRDHREEGLAWTREAVDIAEEQLRKLGSSSAPGKPSETRVTCKECLATGLDNWSTMVSRLAKEERQKIKEEAERKRKAKASSGWLGSLWGQGPAAVVESEEAENTERVGRWGAEEKVIEERRKRVRELLEDLRPLPRGPLSWLQA